MEFVVGDNIIYRFNNNNTTGANGSTNSVVNHTVPKFLGSFAASIGGSIRVKYYLRTDNDYGSASDSGIVMDIRINGVSVYKKISLDSLGRMESVDINLKQGDLVEFYNHATPVGYGGNRLNGIELCCGNPTPIQFISI